MQADKVVCQIFEIYLFRSQAVHKDRNEGENNIGNPDGDEWAQCPAYGELGRKLHKNDVGKADQQTDTELHANASLHLF